MLNLIVDAMGGDNGVEASVAGVKAAISEVDGFKVTLVGKSDVLQTLVHDSECEDRIEIVHAEDVIQMAEPPVSAIRTKKNSSMVVGLNLLHEHVGEAFITAGSTGAMIAGATMIVRRAKNVERAALAPLLPTVKGTWTQLIDCGANVDSKASHLRQFAVMGSVYMNAVGGIEMPRVALLNNGTEEEKGCALTKETYELLKHTPNINFVGNIEARDALSGICDVIVCDGFMGNVLMKSIEGAIGSLMKMLKQELMSSVVSKIGAGLSKNAFGRIKKRMDYREYGGALLLGVNGGVIKAHGDSDARAFKNAVLQAKKFAENNVVSTIIEKFADYKEV